MTSMMRKVRRASGGVVTFTVVGMVGVLSLLGSGEAPASADVGLALPRARPPFRGPPSGEWTRKSVVVTAVRTDLDTVGAHTHANWVFFRLPFDTTDTDRVRDVRVTASAMTDPDVSAIRVGTACAPYKRYGPIGTWALYTVGAVGPTLSFGGHSSPPSDDPTIVGLNVPSRVANYVACGWEKSEALRDPATWHLDASWEER